MGLVVFGAIALYLFVSVAVVIVAARQARKRGRSAWRWGGLAALAMYLLVFWDHIPTLFMHKYYCETEAGFWGYKTVEQWKKENPGVMETLVAFKEVRSTEGAYLLNERFKWTVQRDGPLPIHRWRREYQLVDIKTKEVLGRYVDFYTGNGNIGGPDMPMRFWLQRGLCSDSQNQYDHKFYSFLEGFRGDMK